MNISMQTVVIHLIYFTRFLLLGIGHLPHTKAFFLLLTFCLYTLICFETSESKYELAYPDVSQNSLINLIADIFALSVVICILDLPALIIHKYIYFVKTDIIITSILCTVNYIISLLDRG